MDDEKVTELFKLYGYEGTGLFHAILEKLAKQEKPIKTEILKYQLKVGKRLEKCWKFMEEIGLISSNNDETFNKQLLNYAESYQIKKEKTAKKVSEWRKRQEDIESVTSYETVSNLPKVNKSKVKESKVNNNTVDAPASTLYKDFISVYDQFIQHRIGTPARIDGAQGNAAKTIIHYLTKATRAKNANATDQEILDSWKYLLSKFDRWEPFHQGQLKLTQIASNIENIINSIKNGTNGTRGKQPATTFDQIDRIADFVFGNKPVPESAGG